MDTRNDLYGGTVPPNGEANQSVDSTQQTAPASYGQTTDAWSASTTGADQAAPYGQASQASYGQASAQHGWSAAAEQPYYYQSYQQPGQTYPTQPAANAKDATERKADRKRLGTTFLAGFLGAALACGIGLGGYAAWSSTAGSGTSTVIGGSGASIEVQGEDATLAETVSQKVLPSVVNIDIYQNQQSYSDLFGMMYGSSNSSSSSETLSSLGSGVIISEDGYIVTNQHVVSGADRLVVTLSTGDQYEATVVGEDESSDLAVIKIEAEGLTAVQIGSSSDLTVGEWVMTVGSPYGLEQSVATGIVSATNRSTALQNDSGSYAYYTNMIQTDAAINPGNSGGALVDSDGALIGINTMITSSSGSYSGVGFAIPVDYAVGIAEQIINGEDPTHAQLGVTMGSVTERIAESYGLSVTSGAYVTGVASGSGAEAAGIQEGDVIVRFNGETVATATDLTLAVRSVNPGDTVDVEINRNGETRTLSVTMGSDAGSSSSSSNSGNSGSGNSGGNGYGYGYGYGY